MNLEQIKQKVAQIKKKADDASDANAHSLEDDLHCDFITHIADGDFGELSNMAREVLKAQSISFKRWFE